jgi:hypothetical protein
MARVVMPDGFTIVEPYAPMWLQNGTAVGVVGTADGRTTVLETSLSNPAATALIASDFGPVVPGGRIVDTAASPDGMTIAMAVYETVSSQLNLVLYDVIAPGAGSRIASFTGPFSSESLAWLDSHTLAISLRPSSPPPKAPPQGGTADPASSGLFLVDTTGLGSTTHIPIHCPLSRLTFSPNSNYAVSAGDSSAPPALADLRKGSCITLKGLPIDTLGWSPQGDAFIYATTAGTRSRGVFRYDVAEGRATQVAISSSAAAWTSSGNILALGNEQLTWQKAARAPNARIPAHLALLDPTMSQVQIIPLGIQTDAPLLATSRMVYSQATDAAVIDLLSPGTMGPLRRLIAYILPAKTALLLAGGPARGPVLMSWSPNGNNLAILDSNGQVSVLTVVSPLAELRARSDNSSDGHVDVPAAVPTATKGPVKH